MVCEVAYEPRLASILALLGAGPRSYGLSAACAPGISAVTRPAVAAAAATANPTVRERLFDIRWRRGDVSPEGRCCCTRGVLSVEAHLTAAAGAPSSGGLRGSTAWVAPSFR